MSPMRCPVCGAWTEVKGARGKDATGEPLPYRRRKYECGNLHTFLTYEITEQALYGTDVAAKLKLRIKETQHE